MMLRILPAGDQAVLLELPDLPHTLALFARLQATRNTAREVARDVSRDAAHDADSVAACHAAQASPWLGVYGMVPAARTILLEFDPLICHLPTLLAQVQALAQTLSEAASQQGQAVPCARRVEIPVRYDGQDLESLAAHLDISPRELVERHTSVDYHAAFAGFAPGFVYLAGGDACFSEVPRLATPRTRVPAGAVALAGHFSAVYPKASPGGWQLIGTTPCTMWDLQRAEPALIQPGFLVRFRDIANPQALVSLPPDRTSAKPVMPAMTTTSHEQDEPGTEDVAHMPGNATQTAPATGPSFAGPHLIVRSSGLQTLVQDAGRFGCESMGVSRAGALDGWAMRAANRCVGNSADKAVLENLMGQLVLRSSGSCVLAVTGADAPLHIRSRIGQQLPAATGVALALDDGDELHLGVPRAGLRCYVAVRGGFDLPAVLGSVATDTLAEVGAPPLVAGDVLPLLEPLGANLPAVQTDAAAWGAAARALPKAGQTVTLDITLGPRHDWFDAQALAVLLGQEWQVTAQSNRVGIRLQGQQPLQRASAWATQELPSEGTVAGSLQVPASGQPVLFLADHPLTGGYPVVAVVARSHLDLAAQIPPGAKLRFRLADAMRY